MHIKLKKHQAKQILDLLYDQLSKQDDIIEDKDSLPEERVDARQKWIDIFQLVKLFRQQNPTLEANHDDEEGNGETGDDIDIPF